MSYILDLLPVAPFALAVTIAVYAVVYILLKKKREKPGKVTMLAEFLLVGWVVMFIYVTQIMAFGNGLGDRYNLQPFRQFIAAFRYGSNNAEGVWQFFLNIIMFIPLGFLLPVVFKKLRNWPGVLIVSFAATVITELLQLISYRGTDIDDVIANTAGGLCGFALYLIVAGIINAILHKNTGIPKFKRKLFIGIVVLAGVLAVYVALKAFDGSSKYGSLYYGHLIPYEMEVETELDEEESVRAVYKYSEQISLNDLQEKLLSITGFEGEWTTNSYSSETEYSLIEGDISGSEKTENSSAAKAIFIFPYNTWSVYYEYGGTGKSASSKVSEDEALLKAWDYLEEFGTGKSDAAYDEDGSAEYAQYSDGSYYFDFVPLDDGDNTKVYGDILMELGEDGRLISISDNRIWCEYVEDAECISAADSIDMIHEVGCGSWQGTGVVESVEEGYAFIQETGYLIPTWQIKGYIYNEEQTLDWHPEIDAVK